MVYVQWKQDAKMRKLEPIKESRSCYISHISPTRSPAKMISNRVVDYKKISTDRSCEGEVMHRCIAFGITNLGIHKHVLPLALEHRELGWVGESGKVLDDGALREIAF